MKNQSGITLIALSITIIVLTILLGMTLSYGLDSLKDARQKNYTSEVNIVGQAIAEQYIKIVELGFDKTEVPRDKIAAEENTTTTQETINATDEANKPGVFVGTRISYGQLKEENAAKPINTEFILLREGNSIYESLSPKVLYYVKCYYKLDKNDLATLRINAGNPNDEEASNNSLEYIVNYYTGEVLNVRKKEYYTGIRSGTDKTNVSREQTDINPTTSEFDTVDTEDSTRYTRTSIKDGSEVSDLYESDTTP